MKLIALVLLLSSFSSLTLTEVVDDFRQSCPEFFLPNPKNKKDIITPTVFSGHEYKKICQFWENKYRFATMYDTKKRIPVFSAYTISENVTASDDYWKIEPQLENIEDYKNKRAMVDFREEKDKINKIINQAVPSDYPQTYTRGHVFPKSFAADRDQADSTFTLTNIAPQTQVSNQNWARQVEEPMLNKITTNCTLDQNHKAYIVTGVVPGNNWIPITRNRDKKGINIPSHYWSAFCCRNKNNSKKPVMKAYIAEMEPFRVEEPTIDDLNKKLTKLYKRGRFRVFKDVTV